jgi:hypothetical protein
MPPNFGDAVSSIKIPKGFKVTLYQHKDYGGTSLEYTYPGTTRLYKMNDVASSLRITRVS